MPTPDFLHGVSACCCWAAGIFFFRYWRETRDRLFALFAAAFWILALNWIILVVLQPAQESRHWVFVLRLVAFLLIVVGVWDKNRIRRTP
jgi:drug/metabolite transporter (DMT)-like permease